MPNDLIEIINENEKLIYKIASNYSSYYNIEDLYQVGIIGIIKAYKKYDSSYSVKFSSFAYKYIMGEMIDFIRKDRNIIVSNDIYRVYKKYLEIKEKLQIKYEREVSIKEICEFMEMEEEYLVSIIESVAFTKGVVDENLYYSDDREQIENKLLLDESISLLNDFDRSLINYRYYQGFTQSETACMLGVNQVKVSREEKLILKRLKENLAN